ncbi:unnamed protein product [Albugo candida]|uniref:Peptidase A1 domain-containing protein n=1 Tax=Albugo candida TaxID=65357 RepID=A0A024GQ70_9STRA|nr:unnamed protein product [Albugo candida]|eukprot:CCI49034.1 unnamed protein product [Albugo candida]
MFITIAPEKWDVLYRLDLDDYFTIEYDRIKAQAKVSFTFRIVESGFPLWAYNLLMDAMPKDSLRSIGCAQIPSLKLPTFKFTSDSLEFFTLSKSNYFLREQNDGVCHLMVQGYKSNDWAIGAAVTKTHEAFFYRDDGTQDNKFGFRPLDKPSVFTH